VGTQKLLAQVPTRGNRISILGLWQPNQTFEYALAQGGFDGKSYIEVMNWVADKAALTLKTTGRLTVVVQDNCSIHKRDIVQQHWSSWQDQGLLLFFLPPYSPQMNRIEDQWHQLKVHEMAGQMFEDEYDLALTVIKGMEARSQSGGYSLERLRFNSA
jgi:putative transposase